MSNRVVISSSNHRSSNDDYSQGTDFLSFTYTRGFLETLTDQDLKSAEKALNRHINSLRSRSESTKDYEIELCYVQDEIGRRAKNFLSHKDV